jgi:D-3-phosphoglycerate dehydrogenase
MESRLILLVGIIGYGHIGAQLSVLAEAMGMSVIFYDVLNLMALGTAQQVPTLEALLSKSDFVTCHVPELPETKDMISSQQFEQMKPGAYLINASRGSVVDIPALIHAMRSGKIAGAALDVYPNEPAGNGDYFNDDLNTWASDLRGLKNVILTPHIGGSTEEAQSAIGVEVGQALVRYVNEGTTLGAVNLPEVTLRSLTMEEPNHARVRWSEISVTTWFAAAEFSFRSSTFITMSLEFCAKVWLDQLFSEVFDVLMFDIVNEILGDHNVDKQMTDSRGDVRHDTSIGSSNIAMLNLCRWPILWLISVTSTMPPSRNCMKD